MKPIVRFVCATLCCAPATLEAVRTTRDYPAPHTMRVRVIDLDRLIPALIAVESGGNDRAVGDGGKAKGPLQIWDVVVRDVNRIYGTSYRHDDAFDRMKAIDICRKYLAIYCTADRLGREPSMADAARIWNGGPLGHQKTATLAYWNKVSKHLST